MSFLPNASLPKPCPSASRPAPVSDRPVSQWTEADAIRAASSCLSLRTCESCDLCRMLCPDLCITRDSKTGRIEIDLDYCKGCGVCAFVCPKGAIRMERG